MASPARICVECGGAHFNARVGRYEADYALDAPVRVTGVTFLTCRQCGAESTLFPRLIWMTSAVAREVARQKSRLSARDVRFLCRYLHQQQGGREDHPLAAASDAKISRWEAEAGPRSMPPALEKLLRLGVLAQVAALPEQILAELLAHHDDSKPALPIHVRWDPEELTWYGAAGDDNSPQACGAPAPKSLVPWSAEAYALGARMELRRLRRARRLTLKALGDAAGVLPDAIKLMGRGKLPISEVVAKRLGKALGADWRSLVTDFRGEVSLGAEGGAVDRREDQRGYESATVATRSPTSKALVHVALTEAQAKAMSSVVPSARHPSRKRLQQQAIDKVTEAWRIATRRTTHRKTV